MNEATYQAQIKSAEEAYFDKGEELLEELDEMIENIGKLVLENPEHFQELNDHIKDRLC